MRSSISGSSAAFSSIVFHVAQTAAIIRVSVPVCVFFAKRYVVHTRPSVCICNILSLSSRVTHIDSSQSKCLSRFLFPILSHPGSGTIAFQNLCSKTHKKMVDDLDFSPYSKGISRLESQRGSILVVFAHTSWVCAPRCFIISFTLCTSSMWGILISLVVSFHIRLAIISLYEAFFAPLNLTHQYKGFHHWI